MGDLPQPGIELMSPALAGEFFPMEPSGKPLFIFFKLIFFFSSVFPFLNCMYISTYLELLRYLRYLRLGLFIWAVFLFISLVPILGYRTNWTVDVVCWGKSGSSSEKRPGHRGWSCACMTGISVRPFQCGVLLPEQGGSRTLQFREAWGSVQLSLQSSWQLQQCSLPPGRGQQHSTSEGAGIRS